MDKYLNKDLNRLRRHNNKLRKKFATFGYCYRCHIPWSMNYNAKSIAYDKKRGHFALCFECWSVSSIDERIYYYTENPTSPKTDEHIYNITTNLLLESGTTIQRWLRKKKLESIERNKNENKN